MAKTNIKSEIIKKCWLLLKKLPAKERKSLFLTGGGAAFLYGSDRPFSNDIDFIVSHKFSHEMRVLFGIRFSYYRQHPVFHSLMASVDIDKTSFDLIADSIVQPIGRREEYCFHLTDSIIKKGKAFSVGGKKIYSVPKELLVLIKLVAGRGKELGKYDLYDVQKILEKNKDFDFILFRNLIKEFLKPQELSVPLLLKNLRKIPASKKNKNLTLLISELEKIQMTFI